MTGRWAGHCLSVAVMVLQMYWRSAACGFRCTPCAVSTFCSAPIGSGCLLALVCLFLLCCALLVGACGVGGVRQDLDAVLPALQRSCHWAFSCAATVFTCPLSCAVLCRWERVAEVVPRKNKAQCFLRFKELRDTFRAVKAGPGAE